MPSTYTPLGIEKMVTGEKSGQWGGITNTNWQLVEQSIAGYEAVTIGDSTTTTLVITDGVLSNARNMVIKIATITLSGATVLAIPAIEKFYIIDARAITNPTNLTIKTTGGTGFTLDAAKIYACYSDGTNTIEISLDTLGGTIGSVQIADDAITTAKIADDAVTAVKLVDDAVTSAKIIDDAVTTAKIVDDAVATAKIPDSAVTTAKINDDAVTAAKLADTAVTPAEYASATITVDQQGRITAASAGTSSENTMWQVKLAAMTDGTYTANSDANTAMIYISGSGGGGGGHNAGGADLGGPAAYGVFKVTFGPGGNASHPYSHDYTVGTGGTGGYHTPGNAGNATNFGSPAIITAGGGGAGSQGPGTAGPIGSFSVGTPSDGGLLNTDYRGLPVWGRASNPGGMNAGYPGGFPKNPTASTAPFFPGQGGPTHTGTAVSGLVYVLENTDDGWIF